MRFITWIEGARPKTLIASMSPIFIGSAIAFGHGHFNPFILFNALLTGIFLQIGTNLANDYFDAKKGSDTNSRIGPRRIMQSGLARDLSMKRAIFVAFLIATCSCLYLIIQGGPIISYLLVLAILLGIGYTAGPFALAYLGLGDFFVFFFFGCIATLMTTYLHTGKFLIEAFIAGIAPGALSTAILATNNLRDQISDTLTSKKTLIARFGQTFGKWEYTLLLTTAFLIPPIMCAGFHYNTLILLTSSLFFYSLLLIKDLWLAKTPHEFIPFLPKTSLLLALYTFLFALGSL